MKGQSIRDRKYVAVIDNAYGKIRTKSFSKYVIRPYPKFEAIAVKSWKII